MLLVVGVLLAGCAGADGGMVGGPDSGALAETGTGGSGGSAPATGGTGGAAATGGTGGNGTGGTGGSSPSPDAGAPKLDTMASVDSMPATGEPMACDSGTHMLYTDACLDPPGSKNGKVLRRDGRACIFCATYKSDGRTVEKQFVGCLAAAGAICVMTCGECK
jgi:hypothetical protein